MSRTLYAGGLWFEATEMELKEWFAHDGPIEARSIADEGESDSDPGRDTPVIWVRRWQL